MCAVAFVVSSTSQVILYANRDFSTSIYCKNGGSISKHYINKQLAIHPGKQKEAKKLL